MSDIIKLEGGYWISKTELDNYKKFEERQERKAYHTKFGSSKEYLAKRKIRDAIALPQNRWKLALVTVGNTQKTVYVDNLTNEAYKCQYPYQKTWMKIKKYTFIRWARGMDV